MERSQHVTGERMIVEGSGERCGHARMNRRPLLPVSALVVLMGFLWSCQSCEPAFDMVPVTGGDGEMSIEIVYHPGASGLPTRVARRLQDELVARGYTVSRVQSSPEYVLDQDLCDALVVVSPVYGSTTRPELREFLRANSPFSVPVFAALTGFFPAAGDKRDLPILEGLLEELGSGLAGGIKIGTMVGSRKIDVLIAPLCDQIELAVADR
jgi:hypothetical protein